MDLTKEIKELYKVAKTKIGVTEDPSVTQKINNSDPLTLIEDTENILNKFFEEFEFMEQVFGDEFNETSTRIKKAKRTKNREDNKRNEDERLRIIAEKRQQDKQNKDIKKFGKKLMPRQNVPKRKDVEVKKVTLTEEEQDTLDYLGMALPKHQ